MAPHATKRRRVEDEVRPKKKIRKVKKQNAYHSSSEDEEIGPPTKVRVASDAPRPLSADTKPSTINGSAKKEQQRHAVQERKPILKSTKQKATNSRGVPLVAEASDDDATPTDLKLAANTALNGGASLAADSDEDDMDVEADADNDSVSEASQSDADDFEADSDLDNASVSDTSQTSSAAARQRKKRNDPTAFATSISKILDTKLSSAKRSDPVLSRSRSAAEANRAIADDKLEQAARAQIRAEKKAVSEKGRVKDVLGLETADLDTGAIMEEEKRLKKIAQRGVVKLFNAVRAAQVRAEEAMRVAKAEGVVGMQKREERVNEMSKQGFLDLISSGGKKSAVVA